MNKKWMFFLIILICLIIIVITRVQIITIQTSDNKILLTIPRLTPIDFSFCYKHSVERTWVYEIFRINQDGQILLKETTFSSFGAGLPLARKNFEHREEKGDFIIRKINRELPKIDIRISRTPGQTLTIGQKKFKLQELEQPGERISIKANNILQFIF